MALPEQVVTVTLWSWSCSGRESLEPPGFPFCPRSGNPIEGAKFYRGGGLGKGRCRDREWLVSVGTTPGKNWGLMGSSLEAAWNRCEQGEGGCFGMMCLPLDNALIVEFTWPLGDRGGTLVTTFWSLRRSLCKKWGHRAI